MKNAYIIILLSILIFCFTSSCRSREPIAELEAIKARVEIEVQNMNLVKQYIEAFNKRDLESIKNYLSPEYTAYSPSGSSESTSREKLIENYENAFNAFSEFTWNIEDIIAARDKVVFRTIASGTYKGDLLGIPEKEIPFRFSMINILRIENGKIMEEWQEDDQLGFARQLGYELKPMEAEK